MTCNSHPLRFILHVKLFHRWKQTFKIQATVICCHLMGASTLLHADQVEESSASDRFWSEVWFDFSYERLANRDLDDRTSDDLSALIPEIGLGVDFQFSENIEGYLEILGEGWHVVERERDSELDENEYTLSLTQLYLDVDVDEVVEGLSFRVGRQGFYDTREWLYVEELDGIRAFYELENFLVELSASRERLYREDLFEDDTSDERVNNYILYGSYQVAEEHLVGAYALVRDDYSEDSDNPRFFGLQASGTVTDVLDYWLEMAQMRGRDGSTPLQGYGFDIGGTYRFNAPLEPSLTLSYAFGSGDSDLNDNVDRQFRQTGLQDNSYRFNGVQDFRYYGETLDPELSNLRIFTTGLGIRPSQQSSIDLIYHKYQQDVASNDFIEGALFLVPPNGESRDVGQAIDLVIGYHEFSNVRLRSKFGYFIPGDAFGASASNTYSLVMGIEYSF